MVHTLLGYLDEKRKKNELREKEKINKKFISKVGGKPFWLDRINVPDEKDFHCTICSKLMCFLMQIYAPIDKLSSCFHRCLYLFVCLHCGDQSKCFRIQLPRNNPFYNYYLENNDYTDSEPNTSDESSELDEPTTKEKLNKLNIPNDSDKSEESDNSDESEESRKSNKSNKADQDVSIEQNTCNEMNLNVKHQNTENNEISNSYETTSKQVKSTFNKKLEYLFCCKVCGIPSMNKKIHKSCKLKSHVIFEENKIYISDEKDCESSSTGSENLSDVYEGSDINENCKDLNKTKNEKISNEESEGENNLSENYIKDDTKNDNKKCKSENIENVENKDDSDLDISEMRAFEDIQKEMENKRKIDNVFKNYLKKVQRFPKQIIRYSYNGTPLYSSSEIFNSNKNNMCSENEKNECLNTNKNKVPNCHICGGRKNFEFQVLSTVINYLKIKKKISINKNIVINSKFSIIAVYTCENNCDLYDINIIKDDKKEPKKNRYIQEYVYVQIEN